MKRAIALALVVSFAVVAVSAAPRPTGIRAAPRRAPAAKTAPDAGPQSAHRRSPYVGAISVNAKNGEVLFEDNADAAAYPASVTKLMTLLLVLEDVRAGRYALDAEVVATADAYKSEPSWVGIKVGESMSVRDLCTALMVESANDAAIVLGVHASGSLDAFVARMNERAAALGMRSTRYYNPNGLPPASSSGKRYPWKSFNVSTARDQMRLAREILRHPEALEFTSVKTCDLVKTQGGYRIAVTRRANGPLATTALAPGERLVKQMRNHNNVLRMDKLKIINPDGCEAVDGLKTGYIDAGGSSVVLTGSRKGARAVVVVLGSSSSKERDANATRLLSDALGALSW